MANPAAGQQFGYPAGDLTGKPIEVLLHDRGAWDGVWTERAAWIPAGRPVELLARRKGGSTTCLEVSASAWQSDRRTFVTAILRDVNERRAAEEALWRLNRRSSSGWPRTHGRARPDVGRLCDRDVMLVTRGGYGTIASANPAWQFVVGAGSRVVADRSFTAHRFRRPRRSRHVAAPVLEGNGFAG